MHHRLELKAIQAFLVFSNRSFSWYWYKNGYEIISVFIQRHIGFQEAVHRVSFFLLISWNSCIQGTCSFGALHPGDRPQHKAVLRCSPPPVPHHKFLTLFSSTIHRLSVAHQLCNSVLVICWDEGRVRALWQEHRKKEHSLFVAHALLPLLWQHSQL